MTIYPSLLKCSFKTETSSRDVCGYVKIYFYGVKNYDSHFFFKIEKNGRKKERGKRKGGDKCKLSLPTLIFLFRKIYYLILAIDYEFSIKAEMITSEHVASVLSLH